MRYPVLTEKVREIQEKLKEIFLREDIDIVLKTTMLRTIARQLAEELGRGIEYSSIHEFFETYERGNSPLINLEGEGVRNGEIIVLKECPMVPVFELFKSGAGFPEYWKKIPQEYMSKFKNEAILHPLCVVHQTIRDTLASRIKKGDSVVHSVTVACRSTNSGKIVYSEFGLWMAKMEKEEVDLMIDGKACAFLVK